MITEPLLILLAGTCLFLGYVVGFGYRDSNLYLKNDRKAKRRQQRRYWNKVYKNNSDKPAWIRFR